MKEVLIGSLRRVVLATDGTKIILEHTDLPLPAVEGLLTEALRGLRKLPRSSVRTIPDGKDNPTKEDSKDQIS